jgi:aminoglycoside phosphotransferase (APT) family kinase protein
VPLVPVHTDPSPANVLVTPDRTYLEDWNGFRLSDPLRDIGLLLWWFVSPERWVAALRRFWLPDAASLAAIDRVYWWSAVTSLRVALWIDRQGCMTPQSRCSWRISTRQRRDSRIQKRVGK